MTLTRIALPLPGCAISDEGDRYVASLDVRIAGEDGSVETTGDMLEELLTAIRLRHLAFHPRTRAMTPYAMKALTLVAAIDRHWSSIDTHDEGAGRLLTFATQVQALARASGIISWWRTN